MIQWWQILLLTLYSAYQICDELTIVSSAGSPVFAGFITGLIMGDVTTGLLIGGNLQLFVLGVGTFGGASRIDATSGAVLATAFSVSQGIATDLAITTIAVPVAALLTYFDVLGRMTTTFFAHRIEKLPLVDEDGRLSGLITIKDIEKVIEFPNAAKMRRKNSKKN